MESSEEHEHKKRMLKHLTRRRSLKIEIQRVLEIFWEDVQSTTTADRYLALQIERLLNEPPPLDIPPKGFCAEERK